MAKTNKNETIDSGLNITIIILVLILIATVVLGTICIGTNMEANHQEQLTAIEGLKSDLPRSICYNETTTERLELNNSIEVGIPSGAVLICEDGIDFEYIGSEVGWGTWVAIKDRYIPSSRQPVSGVCLVQTTIEVCEYVRSG